MPRVRKVLVSLFVLSWLLLFNYESVRLHYLTPLAGRPLPKLKLLFPPAGWIMFYRIQDEEVRVQVFGHQAGLSFPIDPHDIFRTRWLGYDNIHRNVLSRVADPGVAQPFCRFLKRKFPLYDGFSVFYEIIPKSSERPQRTYYQKVYTCSAE